MLLRSGCTSIAPFGVVLRCVGDSENGVGGRVADAHLRRPAVSVRICEGRPIYVLGDVKSPGAFPFRYGSSALSAIAQAGGYGGGAEPMMTGAAIADFLLAD